MVDVIVVGGGSAGAVLAILPAEAGQAAAGGIAPAREPAPDMPAREGDLTRSSTAGSRRISARRRLDHPRA